MDGEKQSEPPPRVARLVLVTPEGAVIGRLALVPVDLPWWQDAQSVVLAVREYHGIDVTILRLLEAVRDRPHGGEVTYLAEVAQPVPAEVWAGRLEPHPLRQSYAEPGGPAADLAWATRILAAHGLAPAGMPVQIRSWNLSSIWRIPVARQTVWLKVVPPFFAHEPRVITALAGRPVPELLGHDGGRMLLAEVAGEDMYEAPLPRLLEMVTLLVELQLSWTGRVDQLRSMGLPDWGGPALIAAIGDVTERASEELSRNELTLLQRFISGLANRFAALESCGLPDTLVHGDLHPGNFRGTERTLTLLDWGDSGIGHPMLDQPAFLDRVASEYVETIKEHWARAWLAWLPGCEPARAAGLLAPIAAARQAVIYRRFLDNIEPSEQVYHRHDPADWLRRTAALLRAGS
ncbi:phosphotransferase family protein [Rhizobium leguminosarum]|uniref:phosphotransferase family protein n=1 Tax=Rhizobium leguminosarum TaxID=384 RepID=UPI0012F877A1|nr:aminoglycoside phosphotransferase family protein [Rhizobium leguminosarum]MVO94395.1 phosphotransferase [Rhizobium leguminosarum bv. phaseoli]